MAASDGADLNKALQACARGDRAALRAIYDAEAPRMLGVAQRLLRRPALAEEAVRMRSFRFGDAPRASIPRGAEPAHGSTPSYATGRSTSCAAKSAPTS